MGGIADYSGSLVLQLPLAVATFCAVQPRKDRRFNLVSLAPGDFHRTRVTSIDLDESGAELLGSYESARSFFAAQSQEHWGAYVLGILTVWHRELGWKPSHGLDVLIRSNVPEGCGLSSSAALEVATASAFATAFNLQRDPVDLALDCQRVENLVVGAPCGVMDQMTSVCGKTQRMLKLLCQPAVIQGHVEIPPGLGVWGIDSGVCHSVAGSDYHSVRCAAFMGHRILAEAVGARIEKGPDGIRIPEDPWGGYLANVPVMQFSNELAQLLPEHMSGSEFLDRYGGTVDRATSVDPGHRYPVRAATAHPVYEHQRVHRFADMLAGDAPADLDLGRQMFESHDSYSACGLGTTETNRLVELARQAESQGIYGAKITGGGSGGTVAILGRSDAGDVVNRIASEYGNESGRLARVYTGSSPGAAPFGTVGLHRV
jgi:L-arabinokinase